MARIVQIGPFPAFPAKVDDDARVVALRSADTGVVSLPVYRLTRLAADVLRENGLTAASSIVARHILIQVVARVVTGGDANSLASRLRHILQISLQTGIAGETLIGSASGRVRQLGLVLKEYRKGLLARKLVDPSEVLWRAAQSKVERKRLLVYGHHRARPEEIYFIDAAAADGSVYYLPCGDDGMFAENRRWAEYLKSRGWEIDKSASPPQTQGERLAARFAGMDAGDIRVAAYAYGDIDAEVRGVLSSVKQMLIAGASPHDIALVTRDVEGYGRTVAAVADEFGVRVDIGHMTPIGSTSFGGAVRLMLEVLEKDFRFDDAVRLVMHPLGPKLSAATLADSRRGRASGREKWLQISPQFSSIEKFEKAPLSKWNAMLRSAFLALGTKDQATRRTSDWIAYNGFLDALSGLEKLDADRQLAFEGFAAVISEVLSDEMTPLSPGRGGVRLIEPKDIVGASFENVFVMGLAEGIYPKPASEDPVVDFFERKELSPSAQFASAAEVARWEEMSFYLTLLACRGRVTFSYPAILDNVEALPSSFFARLGVDKVLTAPAASTASSVEEVRSAILSGDAPMADDEVLGYARSQYSVEVRRETAEHYDEYDGVIGVPIDHTARKWSASQLVNIGQCSFGWFAKHLLRLRPVEEMEIGLQADTLGRLYHKTLEIAVGRAKDAEDIRAATIENIDSAFAEAEKDEEVGLPELPNWEAERESLLRDLKKAVRSPEFIAEGTRVVAVEQEFETAWEGFTVRGSIDRVDDTPNGLIAVDYKTGGTVPKGAKDRGGKLSVDVQVPLYANVALRHLYPDGQYGDSSYYSLSKGKVLRTIKPDDMDKLTQLADDIRSILAKGSFAVDPDMAGDACKYCDFKIVCRKGTRLRRKSRA